ncbi:MAG TPA: hypothetical protein VLM40_00500, partial [Gemmata sp.]|nr:hypothetical protein [Gemmata sp.]
AIAVGYPGGVNLAFAADECRLSYGWAGNFLDASPVWNNRGGNPARLLGPKFWSSPAGHPWGLTTNPGIPPDFLARAKNPAFGLPLPLEPARVYRGPMAVHFDGYSLDRDGAPTFRYHLSENTKDAVLQVSETASPLKASAATAFTRAFRLKLPAGYTTWFLAGESARSPRVLGVDRSKPPRLDLGSAEPRVAAAGTRVVLPQDGDGAVVLEAAGIPEGASWRFVPKSGGGWLAILVLVETKQPVETGFRLVVWSLPKDEEALLRDLAVK